MKVKVARIGKPHGIRGEVTVQVFTDEPDLRFAPGSVLSVDTATEAGAAVAPDGLLEVQRSRWNKQILVVSFTRVHDRNTAEALRGSQLFVEGDSDEDDEDAWYEHELVDLEVFVDSEDGPGRIGVVSGLRPMPHQDLLEVTLDADHRTVDVPFVAEIVAEIDADARRVVLTPPPGLLDLGREDATGQRQDADRTEDPGPRDSDGPNGEERA